ncbi:hypothetical protein HIM_01406 [Hirsutella minnesotensis 3608]|nr:hypothetical protein HIM_01406 [Hirsutella minnesotensis 3608]
MLLQMLQQLLRESGSATRLCASLAVGLPVVAFLIACLVAQTTSRSSTTKKLRHLKRLGLPAAHGNMSDQYHDQYAVPEASQTKQRLYVKALYIHPIKSCAPIEVSRAVLTKSGLLYDRYFAVAVKDAPKGDADSTPQWRFISQRTKPSMALIKTELWLPHDGSDPADPLVEAGGCLVVRFPDPDPDWMSRLATLHLSRGLCHAPQVSFILPLHESDSQQAASTRQLETFSIHDRNANGLNMAGVASFASALSKLKQFLKLPQRQDLTIFRCTPDSLVRTTKNLAPLSRVGSPAVHGYTDQQPVNINSLSSVHAVSALMPPETRPLNALRFRANVWLAGAPAYAEESWKRIGIVPRHSASEKRARVAPKLSVVCRTSRCTMPNVNPDDGIFSKDSPRHHRAKGRPQPSTALVEHRTVETGNGKALGYLGMHAVPEDWDFESANRQGLDLCIQVGDDVEVLEEGIHLYGSTGSDY